MNNTIDLWQLLEKYEVVVPVIQRDYAQGRKGKEYIRKTFLTELKGCIDNKTTGTLDFVYGNIEGNRFYPLDGQQRLTTLWLIHWFISLKAGKLAEDKKILSKFSYETRASSGDFCKALCNQMPDSVSELIVDYIKSQTWFYSSWLQDPTINAMLRTLGGDNTSTDDNIEAIFSDVNYNDYRDRLINFSIVNFELMVIGTEKLPISDDLYIKMNARGKGLTNFENFKADLVAWIQSPQNPDKIKFDQKVGIKDTQINYKQYYPAKIDNDWMDVFWNSVCEKEGFNGRIDDIYFSFFNRYVLNEMCLNENMSPAEFAPGKEDEDHKDLKSGFDKLFGAGMRNALVDDSLIDYEGFEIYKPFITFDTLGKLDYILNVTSKNLDIIDKALNIFDADEVETNSVGYSFVPRYIFGSDGPKLASTSQKERVYFLAISLFIENCKMMPGADLDKDKFNRWIRVVRNLIENAAIDNVPGMVTCMRLIRKIAEQLKQHDNDVYITLKDYSDLFSNSQLEKQLKEEKTKAEKILEDNRWESKFEEAEKYAFFNGTIRFLYLNGITVAWDEFDAKFSRAKVLFNDNTVPTNTIILLLKQFSGFEKIQDKYLFTSVGYHARHKCWKKDILCSEDVDIAKGVHSLLMSLSGPTLDADYQSFIDSGLIEAIVSKDENYKYRYHWHYYWVIHKDYSQMEGVYVSLERKAKCEVLKNLIDTGIVTLTDPDFNSYSNGYYWGIKVTFEYDGNQYNWYSSYKNGKQVDKIFKCVNGEESKSEMCWDNASDLISSINSFQSWNWREG